MSKFQARHYITIAAIMAKLYEKCPTDYTSSYRLVEDELVKLFASDNPHFTEQKFRNACHWWTDEQVVERKRKRSNDADKKFLLLHAFQWAKASGELYDLDYGDCEEFANWYVRSCEDEGITTLADCPPYRSMFDAWNKSR